MNHEKYESHEKEECNQISGAIFTMYNELGTGFLKSVYEANLMNPFRDFRAFRGYKSYKPSGEEWLGAVREKE